MIAAICKRHLVSNVVTDTLRHLQKQRRATAIRFVLHRILAVRMLRCCIDDVFASACVLPQNYLLITK